MEGNSGVYDHNNNPDSDDNYNECQETQDSGNDTDADADHSEECHEDDESDEDYQYEEEDEMHPNDEDDLVVNIDASEVVPAEGVQVDVETCPAAASSSSIESTDALFEGITVDPTSKKSERSQLRTQMKKYHPDEEL
ncbi:hypothetical protein FRC12_005889 [Ceratobasidium sp. 428]|nr:hypothetical protein FRC12_005889 [Ceratobasidium sp. 428]